MKFILLDGNSFCYRAFYAIRDLRNSKGQPTNAVFGFITMLEKILKEVDPDGAAVMFDLKGPTFRHERYDQYKIQRQPMPDDLVSQMPVIKDVVRALNIPIYEKEGFEADDVIATVAKKLEKAGHEVFIVTGDKDMLQLVTQKTKVLNPQKENLIYGEAEVKKRFGVGPERIVEIMALMGDTSDNIPGVPGIGPVTASALIQKYGTLENVLKNVPKIKGDRLRESLEKYKDQARLSRELAEIHRSVPVDANVKDLVRRAPDAEKLAALYQALEFRTLMKGLPVKEDRNCDDPALRYILIENKEAFRELKETLSKHKEWAFDFETTGIDPLTAEPIGISFSFREKEAYFVSFPPPHDLLEKPALTAKDVLGELKPLFEDEKIKKIGQNIKYETRVLKNFGIELAGIWFDTMVASYCLDPDRKRHNLDDIAMEQLSVRITSITELIGTGAKQISMQDVALDHLYPYGCQDSDVTLRCSRTLRKKLIEKDLLELFEEIEMKLVPVLAEMETAGVAIDKPLLKSLSKEMDKALLLLTKEIHDGAKCEFNINSPKQLGEILFDKLGLPVVKKTATGVSTDVEVLQKLAEVHSFPKLILKFRELSKLKSTYVDALGLMVNPKTNRLHTSYNQTVAATGRLSSSDPNLQNIPVRTEEGRKIRRAFIAETRDRALVSADYSQIELRVLAHLSGDKELLRAFRDDADIHRHTAGLIFNVPEEQVTGAMRDSAKTVNFGVLYGMGPFSLAKSLNISNEAARDFIKQYFDRYPGIKKYLDGTLEKARKDGFVSTYFKRRRYIPEIASRNPQMRAFAERTAINAPIQGTASDIIKIAMERIYRRLKEDAFASRMILQVHDELVFEAPKKELKKLIEMATEEMQEAVSFEVPLKVSVKAGPNWLDMEEQS